MSEPEAHLAHVPRWLAAAFGGVATSAAQFVGQQQVPKFATFIVRHQISNLEILMLTTLIATFIFMLLGSLAGFFSDEQSRIKLFWLGVGAPALFAVALPGAGKLIDQVDAAILVSPAYAAEQPISSTCSSDGQLTLGKSLRSYFGLDTQKYRVVVGSFRNLDDARSFAKKLSATDPALKAVVGEKAPCNDYYPVTISNGDFVSLERAKGLQAKALATEGVTGAYLSPEW